MEQLEKKKYVRKVNVTGGMVDAYKFYKNKYPKSVIDGKTYVEVCTLFNRKLSNRIITQSFEFRVPYKLGFIRIKSMKLTVRIKDGKIDPKKKVVDWARTKKLWAQIYGTSDMSELKKISNKKLVIHTNEHTNGYTMKWNWDRRSCNVTNIRLYKFNPVKGTVSPDGYYYGRRGLAAWLNNDERTNEYYL